MKNMKKILCAALAGVMALSLAACAPQAKDPMEEKVQAYTQQVAGLDADTVLFTVDGAEVTAEFYLYWLAQDCAYWDYMSQMYYGTELDFTADMEDGVTNAEYLKNDAQTMAASYVVLAAKAAEQNVGLTEEQEAEWLQTEQDYVEDYGQEAYDLLLEQYAVTEATFKEIGTSTYLYQNLLNAITEEEMKAYAQENDLYKAKHILLCTAVENENGTLSLSTGETPTDENGVMYEGTAEEYNQGVKALGEDLLAQLDASEDPVTLFDHMMTTYSEDTGLSSYPDGYTFTSEENFVEEFKNATYELDYHEYSRLVESDYGYHIILREDLTDDLMSHRVNTWIEEMEVVTTEAYDNLDVAAFYEAYKAYEDALIATETPAVEETAPVEETTPVEETPAAE